ncbi:hypothetical protein [Streptomyces sp. NPDC058268]|jgi:hypothetical protein|uniref:deoxynucleotide monophosphate kinase family protein n=1 Tax=Streptomyces sp. NPDC058268 TaxID=3346413 RepID=UPI0036EE6F9D
MSLLPEVLALGGYAYAGKDSVANVLVERYGYTPIRFGDAVRDVLEGMNPLIPTPYGSVNLAWVLKDVGWDVAKREYPEVRRLMQRLGGSVREHISDDAWIRAALKKAEGHPRVVYTDVRHRNELEAVAGLDHYSIWISRPGVGPLNQDVSENVLGRLDFDFGFFNEDELEDLPDMLGLFMNDTFGVEP